MCPLEPYEYDSTNRMLRMEIKIHVLACLLVPRDIYISAKAKKSKMNYRENITLFKCSDLWRDICCRSWAEDAWNKLAAFKMEILDGDVMLWWSSVLNKSFH